MQCEHYVSKFGFIHFYSLFCKPQFEIKYRMFVLEEDNCNMAVVFSATADRTVLVRFEVNLVWQFVMNRLMPEQRFQVAQNFLANHDSNQQTHCAIELVIWETMNLKPDILFCIFMLRAYKMCLQKCFESCTLLFL